MIGPKTPRLRPGETLHPGIEPLFDQLGIGDAVRSAGWLRDAGHFEGDRFVAFGADARGPWLGFQAPTDQLDAMLRSRAHDVGVERIDGWALGFARSSTAALDAVQLEGREVSGRFFVDATGRSRLARRALDIAEVQLGSRRHVFWGHEDGQPERLAAGPRFDVRADGWRWEAQISRTRWAWVSGPVDETWRPLGLSRGADATSTRLARPIVANVVACGDAAFSTSPLSSKGVLRAVMGGIMAAHTIPLTADRFAPAQATAYEGWIASWFEAEASILEAALR